MSTVKPFLKRRPQQPWLGFFLGGVGGALLTALATALAAGVLSGQGLFAHAQPAKLLAATGGTLLAAAVASLVIGPALWWGLPRYRIVPLRSLGLFAAPLALAGLGALLGIPSDLKTFAWFLLPVFTFQAVLSWGLFAWVAYPAYASKKKKKPRGVPEVAVSKDPVPSEPQG
jgi:hypothetical protein